MIRPPSVELRNFSKCLQGAFSSSLMAIVGAKIMEDGADPAEVIQRVTKFAEDFMNDSSPITPTDPDDIERCVLEAWLYTVEQVRAFTGFENKQDPRVLAFTQGLQANHNSCPYDDGVERDCWLAGKAIG